MSLLANSILQSISDTNPFFENILVPVFGPVGRLMSKGYCSIFYCREQTYLEWAVEFLDDWVPYWWPALLVLTTLVTVALAILSLWFVKASLMYFEHTKGLIKNWTIDTTARRPKNRRTIRRVFSSIPNLKLDHSKPHPNSAARRTQATDIINNAIAALGLQPYYFQHSNNSANKFDGSHVVRTVKDCHTEEIAPSVEDYHCLVLVDDDYYEDLPSMLAAYPNNPCFIYTLTPAHAGAVCDDYSYSFDETGMVNHCVEGGAQYRHHLWNFNNDHCAIEGGFWNWYSKYGYLVERFKISENHSIIYLDPIARVNLLGRLMFADLYWNRMLTRFNPIVRGVSQSHVVFKREDDGIYYTIGSPGLEMSADLSARVYSNCVNTVLSLKGIATKETLNSCGVATEATSMAITYFRDYVKQPLDCVKVCKMPAMTVFTHEIGAENVNPAVVSFMNPFVGGMTFCPSKDVGTTKQAIVGRILQFAKNKMPTVTSFEKQCMLEFVDHICKETGVEKYSIEPWSFEAVIDHQRTNKKAEAMKEAMEHRPFPYDREKLPPICMFMKAEPYGKVTDGRNIISYPSNEKFWQASVVYAFAAVIKKCRWYSFVEPQELEDRLLKFASLVTQVDGDFREADASRWDGHFKEKGQQLELMGMLMFFKVLMHEIVATAALSCLARTCVSVNNVIFYILFVMTSGKYGTSLDNSFMNAFQHYVALRHKPVNKGKQYRAYSPDEAYAALGPVGGDDALIYVPFDVDEERIVQVFANFGHELEIVATKVPTFLGRAYGGLKSLNLTSCAVPERVFTKIHVTADKLADPLVKIVEKALSLKITDKHTPIVGRWATKVLSFVEKPYLDIVISKLKQDTDLSNSLYAYLYSDSEYDYQPLGTESWMADYWAFELEKYGFDTPRFYQELENCKNLEDCLKLGPYGFKLETNDEVITVPKQTAFREEPLNPEDKVTLKFDKMAAPGEQIIVVPPKEKEEMSDDGKTQAGEKAVAETANKGSTSKPKKVQTKKKTKPASNAKKGTKIANNKQ